MNLSLLPANSVAQLCSSVAAGVGLFSLSSSCMYTQSFFFPPYPSVNASAGAEETEEGGVFPCLPVLIPQEKWLKDPSALPSSEFSHRRRVG